jgi:hypothetical protein
MNLREGGGRVPIKNSTQHEATPYLLVDFPTRSEFDVLYSKHKSALLKDRYWGILTYRSQGHSLRECGNKFGLTRERVRQIEARFQRLVGQSFSTQLEAKFAILSAHRSLLESFSSSEMHGMSPASDDSH